MHSHAPAKPLVDAQALQKSVMRHKTFLPAAAIFRMSPRMRFRAIVQARLSSTRLPRKVLQTIGKSTILEHIHARLATLEGAGVETVFAIAEGEPDELHDFLREHQFVVTTGPVFDVLGRYISASQDLDENDFVLRLTGDNPFPDKDQLAGLVHYARQHALDYGYTADLPLGMGAEIVRVNALRSIWLRAQTTVAGEKSPIEQYHREHVTVFIRENPHLYEIYPHRLDPMLTDEAARERVRGIRLTVDELADLEVCRGVFAHFERRGMPFFGALDVIQLALNTPEMLSGNAGIAQRSARTVDERALQGPASP